MWVFSGKYFFFVYFMFDLLASAFGSSSLLRCIPNGARYLVPPIQLLVFSIDLFNGKLNHALAQRWINFMWYINMFIITKKGFIKITSPYELCFYTLRYFCKRCVNVEYEWQLPSILSV